MRKGIILKSVGSFISSSGVVYPMNNNNEPNFNEYVGVHISDVSKEWIDKLSDEDTLLIDEGKYIKPPTRNNDLDSIIVDLIGEWFIDNDNMTRQDLDTLLVYSEELYNQEKG
tara:strand:+ start:4406 stop:4744 length:339 start_codon:yes stop_codon:yes gene_type:complete